LKLSRFLTAAAVAAVAMALGKGIEIKHHFSNEK